MMSSNSTENRASFDDFYNGAFIQEHQHPLTIALHVFGTVAGLLWLVVTPILGMWYLIILFPIVHAVPGLIGHRLFERNKEVGDVRITRKDFPIVWFIIANHRLTWDLIRRRF